jgi:anti-sigma B factor antagonist
VASENGVVLVSPAGDLGTHESPQLRTILKQAFDTKPSRVVVDLSGVGYMATAGIATLVEAERLAKSGGVPLVLCGLQERVLAVFKISSLTKFFRIEPSLEMAKK